MGRPDLKKFKGKSQCEIFNVFAQRGYEQFDHNGFIPPKSDYMVKVCTDIVPNKAFADLCKKNEDNPFFPKVYDARKADKDTYVVLLERLRQPEGEHTQYGICRAVSTFVQGDEMHKDVHKSLMEQDKNLVHAGKEIVKSLVKYWHQEGEECLFYDAFPDNVWVRKKGDHEVIQPVFRNPFRITRKDEFAEKQIRKLCARFDVPFDLSLSRKKATPKNGAAPS